MTEQVLALKKSLPVFVGDKKAVQRFPLVSWAYRLEGIMFLCGLVSLIIVSFSGLMPVDRQRMVTLLVTGLCVAAAFVPLAFLIARGHSRGVKNFRWLSILGFICFPLGLLGLGMTSNCMLDTSEPKAYYVEVVDENEYCYKDRVSVGFRDWRNPQGRFYIQIFNTRVCDAAKQGDYFVVVIKDGFLGWPWIKDFHPHQPQ